MATRRAFLQTTAATGAAVATLGLQRAAAGELGRHSLYRVIGDQRFAESIAFAQEAERLGHPVSFIRGDITRLWFEDLDRQWRREPAAVAGLTDSAPLFLLERMAWDHGMRVIFRADHLRQADGGVRHEVSAPEQDRSAGRLAAAGALYPQEAARQVGLRPAGDFQVRSQHGPAVKPSDPEPLVSWVIAPLIRA